MKKKVIVISVVVIALIVCAVLYFHYTPVWISTFVVIATLCGAIVGWFAKVLYDKYIKD